MNDIRHEPNLRPSTGPGEGGGRPWPLLLFFTANVLFGSGLFFHAFLYNFYLDGLGLGESVMGGAAAALTAGGLAALIPAGALVDLVGARVAYLGAAATASAGLAAGAFVERPGPVFVAALAAGAGTAAWRVSMGPILMQLTSGRMRSRAFSWNVALLLGTGAIWTALAGWTPGWMESSLGLGRLGGIRGTLLLGALGTAASAAVFGLGVRVARSPGAAGRSPSRAALDTLRIPGVLVLLVALVAVWMTAGGLVIPFFNLYFLREHALEIDRIGFLFAAAQALTAAVVFGSGELASRIGPVRALTLWMFVFPPVLWGMAAAESLGLAVLLYLIQGLVPPATNPLIDQILLERTSTDQHGAISSWRNGATELSGLVGSGMGGVILETASFPGLLGAAGGVALMGAGALSLALRRTSPASGAEQEASTGGSGA